MSTAGVEPASFRFRKPAPSPFGHVDMAPSTGLEPAILRLDGPALQPVELRQHVRALGLEPSLVPVKSRVPYPSGVTRVGGSGGNRTPCVGSTAALQAAAPHGATGPSRESRGRDSDDDAYAVVKVLVAGTGCPGAAQARKVSNPRPAVLETAAPPWLEPKKHAHDEVRDNDRTRDEARTLRLPRASRRFSDTGVTVRVGTRARRRAGVDPASCFRRCVCVP